MRHTSFLLFLLTLISCQKPGPGDPPQGYRSATTLKLAYALGQLDLIDAEPVVPSNLTVYNDLVYKVLDDEQLALDIYHLDTLQKAAPLLIFIHGGAWRKGNRDDYRRYLVDYAEKGFVTATVSYRLSPKAHFPDAFDDVVCALKWLKSNADQYHINQQKIALIGGSAGAHLAMLVAYHASDTTYVARSPCVFDTIDAKVQAVVDLYGPTDLTTEYARSHPSVTDFMGVDYSANSEHAFEEASPLYHLSKGDPPTLIFHGTLDDLVPVEQADRLAEKLKENTIAFKYHRLEGWPHTMDLSVEVNKFCQFHMDAFLRENLMD